MILVKKQPGAGDLLVAQNRTTFECLVFSDTGTPYAYDTDHSEFDDAARYKPRSNVMPATEAELRADFFGEYERLEKEKAKEIRNSVRSQPLEYTKGQDTITFDMDELSRENIKEAIASFQDFRSEAVSNGHPNDGTIPWTMSDDVDSSLSLADLQGARAAAFVRGFKAHLTYRARKAELAALKAANQ